MFWPGRYSGPRPHWPSGIRWSAVHCTTSAIGWAGSMRRFCSASCIDTASRRPRPLALGAQLSHGPLSDADGGGPGAGVAPAVHVHAHLDDLVVVVRDQLVAPPGPPGACATVRRVLAHTLD